MCAAFGAALILKALEMTSERAKAENTDLTTRLSDALRHRMGALSRAADDDSAAFDSFFGGACAAKKDGQ